MKRIILLFAAVSIVMTASAQQVPNAGFEQWDGVPFKNNPQPSHWNACNVSQFGFKFNFAHREEGHSGQYCLMVQDQEVGAAGITKTSPGYFSLGKPWVFLENLFKVRSASAGTTGGIEWTHRPDTLSVWIKRVGPHTDLEDFYLLYYAWKGISKGTHYKGENGQCTAVEKINEESDIRQALDGNECGTDLKALQVAEGMWRERRTYGKWTNIKVPIYYFSSQAPTMMNLIFSASNYPNFRANSGLYAGNSLYVDDIKLIYSDKIQQVLIDGKPWTGFNMNSEVDQVYTLPAGQTQIPTDIAFVRGIGRLTNSKGATATFHGRKLTADEVTVEPGVVNGKPMLVHVKAGDGSSTRTYRIQFVTSR